MTADTRPAWQEPAERAAIDAWHRGSADSTQMLIAVRAALRTAAPLIAADAGGTNAAATPTHLPLSAVQPALDAYRQAVADCDGLNLERIYRADRAAGALADAVLRAAAAPSGETTPPPDELVERVAEAMYEADKQDVPGGWYVPWADADKYDRKDYTWRAQHAIEAMPAWVAAASVPAAETTPAEAYVQGYAAAVAHLWDDRRYAHWRSSAGHIPDGPVRWHLADYLEAVGPAAGVDATDAVSAPARTNAQASTTNLPSRVNLARAAAEACRASAVGTPDMATVYVAVDTVLCALAAAPSGEQPTTEQAGEVDRG